MNASSSPIPKRGKFPQSFQQINRRRAIFGNMRRRVFMLLCPFVLAGCSVLPGEDRGRTAAEAPRGLPRAPSGEVAQCLSELGATGASFAIVPDRYTGEGCSTLGAVQLSSLTSDAAQLQIGNIGPVTCEVSQAFAAWARFGADRASRQVLGSPLRRIETFGSYACRNVAGSSRRSGHATASAIDIAAFVLADGRRISVKQGWNGGTAEEQRFLRVVQQSACKRFATVLGPAYNAAHEDHFHLEGVGAGRGFCR